MHLLLTILSYLPFYLLGSFPTGVIIARSVGVDITQRGSGNVGATNVARILGKKLGFLTLLGDFAKGALSVLFAMMLTNSTSFAAAAGAATVAGHCFSIPRILKGGKGVATSLGVIFFLNPILSFAALATFFFILFLTRYVSLASVISATLLPVFASFMGESTDRLIALGAISAIVMLRHAPNIQRLIRGSEPRFKH